MSFVSKLFTKSVDVALEVSKVAELSECSAECDASECVTKFPRSMNMSPEILLEPLWNSTKPYALHCLVSTGKSDWQHDACDKVGTLQNTVSDWGSQNSALAGGAIKVTVSSFPIRDTSSEFLEYKVGDILLMPYFVWVRDCPIEKAPAVLSELVPKLILANESGSDGVPTMIDGVKIEPSNNRAMIFLCSHRTRDKKCGVTAPLMKKELDLHLREHELFRDFGDDRPGGVCVGFINHVGGHKFAANVLIYMKNGEYVWFAKCKPTNCKPIIEETILNGGKVWPDLIRNIQRCNPITW